MCPEHSGDLILIDYKMCAYSPSPNNTLYPVLWYTISQYMITTMLYCLTSNNILNYVIIHVINTVNYLTTRFKV